MQYWKFTYTETKRTKRERHDHKIFPPILNPFTNKCHMAYAWSVAILVVKGLITDDDISGFTNCSYSWIWIPYLENKILNSAGPVLVVVNVRACNAELKLTSEFLTDVYWVTQVYHKWKSQNISSLNWKKIDLISIKSNNLIKVIGVSYLNDNFLIHS